MKKLLFSCIILISCHSVPVAPAAIVVSTDPRAPKVEQPAPKVEEPAPKVEQPPPVAIEEIKEEPVFVKASDRSDIRPVDSAILPKLLKERGFEPGEHFKALVIEIVPSQDGSFTYHRYDYNDTSSHRDNWWPASTVKLYAAIAAMEKMGALGFTPAAELTFVYEEDPFTSSFKKLVEKAITDSKNPAFDRLVELVGFDRLNRYFLVEDKGIKDTVMLRAYTRRVTYPDTGKGCNLHSSEITIVEKDKEKVLSEKTGKGKFQCPNQGNCTTLTDLTEALRRVMMHETLPKKERYKLRKKHLKLLRKALKGKFAKGGVADGLRAAYKDRPIELYHKAGYAAGWFCDNIYVHALDTDERWILGMVNYGGRPSLDEGALHVATLVADGRLTKERLN